MTDQEVDEMIDAADIAYYQAVEAMYASARKVLQPAIVAVINRYLETLPELIQDEATDYIFECVLSELEI